MFYTIWEPGSADYDFKMIAVDIATTPAFAAGVPRLLGRIGGGAVPVRNYDVAPDGRSFLTVRENMSPPEPLPSQIMIVQNWFEELQARVPSK